MESHDEYKYVTCMPIITADYKRLKRKPIICPQFQSICVCILLKSFQTRLKYSFNKLI